MNVITHQHIAMDLDAMSARCAAQDGDEPLVVVMTQEDLRSVVAALNDVVGYTCDPKSSTPCHAGIGCTFRWKPANRGFPKKSQHPMSSVGKNCDRGYVLELQFLQSLVDALTPTAGVTGVRPRRDVSPGVRPR
jgi:hypothetical protein